MDDRNTKAFKNARADLLRDAPMCHWCGIKPATEADHLVPVMHGGTHHDGLVASCKPCNSRRGAQEINKQTSARITARNHAIGAVLLDSQNLTPPTLSQPYLLSSESEAIQADLPEFGRTEPRLETVGVNADSYGPAVASFASRVLGVELFPWQVVALSGQLACAPGHSPETGTELQFRESLITSGRQAGKSKALLSLGIWWVTEFAARRGTAQSVVVTANRLDRASALVREMALVLEAKFGAKCFWSYGRESINMPDGSTIKCVAATGQNHGLSVDLLLADEIWDLDQNAIGALKPSMIARRSPLFSQWSTAGDESSVVMQQLRSQAINAIDSGKPGKLYFAEWSPPSGVNLEDRQYWAYSNPSLGRTITWDALEAAFASPDRAQFLRAHLNVWVSAAQSWLPFGMWAERLAIEPMPEGGIIAIDSSLDGSTYCGVRAANGTFGPICTVEFVVQTEAEAWAEVTRVMQNPLVTLAVTPSLEIHTPPDLRRRMQIVGYGELLKFTSLVRNMIVENRLTHTGEISLSEQINRAVMGKQADGMALSSKKSPGPIELARCLVWASALASKPKQTAKPAFAAR